MSRVCFKQNSVVSPAQHSIEDSNFAEVVFVAAKLSNDFDEEAGFHSSLHPFELRVWADEYKVVAMDNTSQIARGMLEAAWAGFASFEAHQCKLFGQEGFPSRWGIACAIEATIEPGAHAWDALLGRQVDIDLPFRHRVQVRLSGIYDEQFAATATVASA